jgi:hypothetical protein
MKTLGLFPAKSRIRVEASNFKTENMIMRCVFRAIAYRRGL